jgi:putative GTP pyrophosphokinase
MWFVVYNSNIQQTIKKVVRVLGFEVYGVTEQLLESLSYESVLGKTLKNTLRKFGKENLING